jgi:hypothetical protein
MTLRIGAILPGGATISALVAARKASQSVAPAKDDAIAWTVDVEVFTIGPLPG